MSPAINASQATQNKGLLREITRRIYGGAARL
jgi:hypothetical protein